MRWKLVNISHIKLTIYILPFRSYDILNIFKFYLIFPLSQLILNIILLNNGICQEPCLLSINNSHKVIHTDSYFVLDNKPFKFVGGFVPGWHFGDTRCTDEINEDLIKTAKENGINVLHIMLPWIESELNVFDEFEVNKLDRFINCASDYGVYIMPSFIHGLAIATQTEDPYYNPQGIEGLINDSVLKCSFKERINYLINHINSVSGIRYSDDPTILAWILISEPISASWNYPEEPPNVSVEELNCWIEEMASYVKDIDTNHLVTFSTTAAIDVLGEDWPNVFDANFLDFYYPMDQDMRILNYFYSPDDYPLRLFSMNKAIVMGVDFTSGKWSETDLCNNYPLQSQLIYDAISTYIDTGAIGCIIQRWGSTLSPFVPESDSCYTYNSSYDTICYSIQQASKKAGSFQYPSPPLKFVTIKTTTRIHIDTSICEGDSYYASGDFQTSEGVYYDTIFSSNQNDSILITKLSISPTFKITIDTSICQGMSYFIKGAYQTTSGIYYDTLQTIHGCDSVIITELTVHSIYETNLTSEICEGESILLGGVLRTKSGNYYDTLLTRQNCDSIIVTNLTVNVCSNVGLKNDDKQIKVYPVPTNGLITIKYKHIKYIELYNNSGVLILKTNKNYINFKKYPKGIYYLNIFDNYNSKIRRTIIYY